MAVREVIDFIPKNNFELVSLVTIKYSSRSTKSKMIRKRDGKSLQCQYWCHKR